MLNTVFSSARMYKTDNLTKLDYYVIDTASRATIMN